MPASNNPLISTLLGDFVQGGINMIYGNASSGKTTCCLLALISAAEQGKVIYIDTEKGFNTDRLKQLYGRDISPILEKTLLMQPKDFFGQEKAILDAKKMCVSPSIRLVIVDTVSNFYKIELASSPKEVNSALAEQLANLVRIARDLGKTVLITSQVYSSPTEKESIKVVGGKMLMKLSKAVIELNKDERGRLARLIKSDEGEGRSLWFEIKEEGLFPCNNPIKHS
jgi:DNA repair protein RadB